LTLLPQAASYEFTTLTCVPGIVRYRGAKIQMLDLPGGGCVPQQLYAGSWW
jgi:ribosome-interacting GTPase 1